MGGKRGDAGLRRLERNIRHSALGCPSLPPSPCQQDAVRHNYHHSSVTRPPLGNEQGGAVCVAWDLHFHDPILVLDPASWRNVGEELRCGFFGVGVGVSVGVGFWCRGRCDDQVRPFPTRNHQDPACLRRLPHNPWIRTLLNQGKEGKR